MLLRPMCLGCIGAPKTYSNCMAPVCIHSGHHLKESCAVETFSLEPVSRYSLLMSPLPRADTYWAGMQNPCPDPVALNIILEQGQSSQYAY